MKRFACISLCATCACSPIQVATPATVPVGTLYQDVDAPLAYKSLGLRETDATAFDEVHAEACQYALVVPPAVGVGFLNDPTSTNMTRMPTLGIAWGDAGFQRVVALAKAQTKAPLLDVRFDLHTTALASIFIKSCLELHASTPRAPR
jgi:hypothetical protein